MKKLWFRAKYYGYGWYPSSWEGWLVLLAYLALLFAGQLVLIGVASDENGRVSGFLFAAYVLLITAALIAVAAKTGEKPGWRWGKPKK
ncbi:MAG TPA: hypothetical protein VL500_01735 [Candidatus Eisenbacteria bacterium]|jgi:hypothetical protein|nr:hypothetical protein [Candidatus Eisenbacteria bacterium]